jgi:hypothetical protein
MKYCSLQLAAKRLVFQVLLPSPYLFCSYERRLEYQSTCLRVQRVRFFERHNVILL